MKIISFNQIYAKETAEFVLSILTDEFGFFDKKLDADLFNIEDIYQKDKKSNFWLAVENESIIGTIAVKNCGNQRAYLKRMFVKKEFRGRKIAQKLLEKLVKFAKENDYEVIYLATVAKFKAAVKFYKKSGFKEIENLPSDIPPLGDDIFFEMKL